jgi:hypothetical protein
MYLRQNLMLLKLLFKQINPNLFENYIKIKFIFDSGCPKALKNNLKIQNILINQTLCNKILTYMADNNKLNLDK